MRFIMLPTKCFRMLHISSSSFSCSICCSAACHLLCVGHVGPPLDPCFVPVALPACRMGRDYQLGGDAAHTEPDDPWTYMYGILMYLYNYIYIFADIL